VFGLCADAAYIPAGQAAGKDERCLKA
jgi:hypothetical protein